MISGTAVDLYGSGQAAAVEGSYLDGVGGRDGSDCMIEQRRRFFWNWKHGAMKLTLCGIACGLLCIWPGAAQQIPIVNPPGQDKKPAQPLEIERVEIHSRMALPTNITRPAGPFVLLLVNETGNPKASFAVRPARAATAILVFDAHTPEVKRRKAGILDLPKGQYELQAVDSGRVLCTITIK